MNPKHQKSALIIQKGIEQPPTINKEAVKLIRNKKPALPQIKDLISGILEGNITTLSKAITLIESTLPKHQQLAQQIIEACLPHSGKSIRIGITGVPGVGKSTFIEALGKYLTEQNHKLAVLAIDPSSCRTKGSILGDKTRMENLSADPNAFIRPSPSSGTLGGVARKTWETIILCEAAGFDTIFVETVGVGQSETLVHSMVDFFLLLMLPNAGDELQGIKRGIIEMADAIVINKADGIHAKKAQQSMVEYQNALHLFPLPPSGWKPVVKTCSAIEKTGIAEIWEVIKNYIQHTQKNGYFDKKRNEQEQARLYYELKERLLSDFYNTPEMKTLLYKTEKQISSKQISAYIAAGKLIKKYYRIIKNKSK